MRTVNLEAISFATIHACFVRAFSDYAVGIANITESALLRRATKNGWVPRFSAGVVDGDELVAITMVGVDTIDGERRAYDICTGIIPAFRGRGLAGTIIRELEPVLSDADITAFQLEVLQNNAPAIKAYQKAGFAIQRRLCSYTGAAESVSADLGPFKVEPIDHSDLLSFSSQLEYTPSFEQRDRAIEYLGPDLTVLGARLDKRLVAVIAYDPQTRWLMRLFTDPGFRRRGAASALLQALARQVDGNTQIRAINIDAGDVATQFLMQSCGLQKSLGQWEMRRDI